MLSILHNSKRILAASLMGSSLLSTSAISMAGTRTAKDLSWGKAGISFDTYRRDAMECGIGGAKVDIAGRQDTRDVLDAMHNQDKEIDRANARSLAKAQDSQGLLPDDFNEMVRNYASIYQRGIRGGVARTQGFMEDTVTACLRTRGYMPFRLTEAQAKARDRLPLGTLERRRYLYELASDPVVLSNQGLEPPQPAPQ